MALKTLGATSDERALRALLSGVRQLQRIEHPHLACVRDAHLNVELQADVIANLIVYEFIDGPNLHAEMRRVPWPVECTVGILRQLLAGLSALHSADLVHGSLHPKAAIWRAREAAEPLVVLVGGGLGPVLMHHPTHYTAPEQSRGEPPSTRSDIFSCGAMAFEMLTAQRPWLTGTLRESTRGVPARLVQLLETWVSADPTARPSDARAALAVLDTWSS